MPRIHGRRPEVFPGVLARGRAVFSDDEMTAEMLPDGCWEIVISEAGWMRHFAGKPELQAGGALVGYLAHGVPQ
jgi:hypothetical protein